MKTIDILPDAPCVGYYWMSDATDPIVIESKVDHHPEKLPMKLKEVLEDSKSNPFVVEAQLFYPKELLSVGIRYVDGDYVITKKTVAKEDMLEGGSEMVSLRRYAAHRMPGKRLLFLQYWEASKDKFCAEMDVLQPKEMAFIGFEPIKTEKGK